jgi:hypothetical protein
MYHVAYDFIDFEIEENWMWFMAQLHKAIGDLLQIAICTDACLGLTTIVNHFIFAHGVSNKKENCHKKF